MADWYGYSVTALFFLGLQRFLYKVAAERGWNSGLTTAIFMGTVAVLSGAWFLASETSVASFPVLVALAFVNSLSFAGATISHIEALNHLPAGITFPLTRMSLALVVLVSVSVFQERPSPWQWLRVFLGLAVVAVFARDAGTAGRTKENPRTGFLLVVVCIVCGTVAAVSSKLASISTDIVGFMALSYLLGTLFSLAIEKKWGSGRRHRLSGEVIGVGVLMGVLNFFGFYAFLAALGHGPLSAVAMITGMHFVIAIFLSVLLFRERLTPWRGVGIGLTILAVVLLRA